MTQMEISWKTLSLYSRLKNILWKLRETVLENISGLVHSDQTVSGSGLIRKNLERNEPSILIRYISELNITMIPIVWTNLLLRRSYFNTMIRIILIDERCSGSFEKNGLILLPQWTSPILLERSLILLLSLCLVLTAIIIITS